MNSITLNEAAQRFELAVDGETAFVDFKRWPGGISYTHTEVPQALGGRGIGSELARQVLDWAAANGLKVRAECDFLRGYAERHAQYAPLLVA